MSKMWVRAALFTSVLSPVVAHAGSVGPTLFDYNAVVAQKWTIQSNDVIGNVFGNNVQFNNTPNFKGNAYIAGTITNAPSQINVESGKVFTTSSAFAGTISGGGSKATDAGLGDLAKTLTNQITSYSDYYGNLGDTAGASVSVSDGNKALNLNASGLSGNVVITLDLAHHPEYATLSNQYFNFNMNFGAGGVTSLVINVVGGGALSFDQGGFPSYDASFASKVLWNFEDATELDLNRNWAGTILGPNLTVNTRNQNLNGGAYVANLNQSAELHEAIFTGPTPPVAVPLPAGVWGGVGLLAAMGVGRAMRRRA